MGLANFICTLSLHSLEKYIWESNGNTPWTQDINSTYIRRSEDVKDVIWMSLLRWIYVTCVQDVVNHGCRLWSWCQLGLSWVFRIHKLWKLWDHLFSKYAKFSEKLTFLTPRYAHASVLESLFNKVAGLKACNFIKKRHQHRCVCAAWGKKC